MTKVIQDNPNRHKFSGLYAITPACKDDNTLYDYVGKVLSGGVQMLQYRDKISNHRQRLERAVRLVKACGAQQTPLIINDDIELALACGADGVHLGRGDGDLRTARRRLGPHAIIGASCYNDLELAKTVAEAGADYLALGSMYSSVSKPEARRCSLTTLTAACGFGLPVVAIGGITLENAAALLAAGADMLAVIGDLATAADPAQRARQYRQLWT